MGGSNVTTGLPEIAPRPEMQAVNNPHTKVIKHLKVDCAQSNGTLFSHKVKIVAIARKMAVIV